jgi:hypothetical protein
MTDIDLTSADWRRVLPTGYTTPLRPAAATEQPAAVVTKGNAAEEAFRALTDAQRRLGTIGLAVDMLGIPPKDEDPGVNARLSDHAASELAHVRDRLRTALRAVGLLIPALLVAVGLTLGGTGAGSAQAAEGPEPDPAAAAVSVAARTVPVVLSASPVTARIRVTTPHVTPRGYHCASVWSPVSFLGRACSRYATFTVPVVLGRFTPLGRSVLAVTDDVAPMDTTPARVVLKVRRPSRFGVGTWTPTYWGDGLTVTATLYAYTPALAAWTPQKSSPVKVQELRAGRWVTVATLTTNSRGVFTGSVTLGGGPHTVRVARVQGATVAATVGTAHTFYLVPTDVPVDVI